MCITTEVQTMYSVLVVDDAIANISVLREILKDEYNVKAATNGESAIKIVQKTLPDIILLDIMMPEMSGYEVCKFLKEDYNTKDIPVIFVTAKDQELDEIKGFECGAVDYINKPVSPAITKARIKTHLIISEQRKILKEHVKKIAFLNSQMQNELKLAKKIQSSLITVDKNLISGYDIGYQYHPADYLGGDFIELKPISDNIFGFFVSDVSGHGLSSSLFTFMIKTSFNFWSLAHSSPAEVLQMMNDDLIKQIKEDYYFTAAYGILDIKKDRFKYASGGHTKSIIYRQKLNKIEVNDISGFPLCMFDSNEVEHYKDYYFDICSGDMFFIFTDGLIEKKNKDKEQYGYSNLIKIIENNKEFSVQNIIDKIIEDNNNWVDETQVQTDDNITNANNGNLDYKENHVYTENTDDEDDITIIGFKKL